MVSDSVIVQNIIVDNPEQIVGMTTPPGYTVTKATVNKATGVPMYTTVFINCNHGQHSNKVVAGLHHNVPFSSAHIDLCEEHCQHEYWRVYGQLWQSTK
jgi:hypothetical protein